MHVRASNMHVTSTRFRIRIMTTSRRPYIDLDSVCDMQGFCLLSTLNPENIIF